jgi:hypothetical protein
MTPELQDALVRESARLGANPIDRDIFNVFPKLTDDLDPSNSEAITEAVRTMTEKSPALFRKEKGWEELSENQFQEREQLFRAGLRNSTPLGSNPFASLDTALLSQEQEQALTRHLSGQGSSFDRSILQHALAQQRKTLGGDKLDNGKLIASYF